MTARTGQQNPPRNIPGASVAIPRHLLSGALLLATLLTVSLVNPAFASAQNLRDLLVQAAPVVIVGCAMTFVLLTGEIDISVGSLMGFLGALMGVLASPERLGLPVPVVIVLTLAAGAGVGLLNGVLVAAGRVPSIIATLGMLTILRGFTDILMGGKWITDLPADFRFLGIGAVAGLPVSIWTAALVAAVALFVARRTALGIRIRAIGGNPEAAAIARVSPNRVKILVFAMTGAATALAALVTVPQQTVIEPGIGAGFELVVVTAVVVGGTSIRGGYGGIAGTIIAAILLGSIRTALVFLNLGDTATYWERAIQGGFILAAVLVDHLSPALRPGAFGAGAAA